MAHLLQMHDSSNQESWGEFECEKCHFDMDFFDLYLVDVLEKVETKTPVECAVCNHASLVEIKNF